ncbi:hypothetical protein N177_1148 [Lutibaculum baratangense AMV1]|uniref:Uncharacterized protein n=1 Tax=Lutibaculum baratangense AMV1 TaxID=631454 RepID=V4TIJ3_9HYPH|nr:hypothetical protein N177_1148 [Lutibaculum baratangense AMV1]
MKRHAEPGKRHHQGLLDRPSVEIGAVGDVGALRPAAEGAEGQRTQEEDQIRHEQDVREPIRRRAVQKPERCRPGDDAIGRQDDAVAQDEGEHAEQEAEAEPSEAREAADTGAEFGKDLEDGPVGYDRCARQGEAPGAQEEAAGDEEGESGVGYELVAHRPERRVDQSGHRNGLEDPLGRGRVAEIEEHAQGVEIGVDVEEILAHGARGEERAEQECEDDAERDEARKDAEAARDREPAEVGVSRDAGGQGEARHREERVHRVLAEIVGREEAERLHGVRAPDDLEGMRDDHGQRAEQPDEGQRVSAAVHQDPQSRSGTHRTSSCPSKARECRFELIRIGESNRRLAAHVGLSRRHEGASPLRKGG